MAAVVLAVYQGGPVDVKDLSFGLFQGLVRSGYQDNH